MDYNLNCRAISFPPVIILVSYTAMHVHCRKINKCSKVKKEKIEVTSILYHP